jgi:hypothetical protein
MCKDNYTRWRVELESFIKEVTSYSVSGYGRVRYVQYNKLVHYVTIIDLRCSIWLHPNTMSNEFRRVYLCDHTYMYISRNDWQQLPQLDRIAKTLNLVSEIV